MGASEKWVCLEEGEAKCLLLFLALIYVQTCTIPDQFENYTSVCYRNVTWLLPCGLTVKIKHSLTNGA